MITPSDTSIQPFLTKYFQAISINAGFLISPFIALIFKSKLVYPCSTLAGTQILCLTTIEILAPYKLSSLKTLQTKAFELQEKRPYLQTVATLAIVATYLIFPLLSCIFGALLGIYTSFITNMIYQKRLYSNTKISSTDTSMK